MTSKVICGDCVEVMRGMPAQSVDLIVTDPPYFKVKGEAWDRQWDTPALFLAWLGKVADEWRRVLRPNGSLYVFASPKMAARVELLMAERFEVIQRITWAKPPFATKAEMFRKGDLRSYFPVTEAIIFAEHKSVDNMVKGDELRGFQFEPLRAYLADERNRAGFTTTQVSEAFRRMTGNPKSGMAGHWFVRSQWALPTAENYAWLRELFSCGGRAALCREYDELRAEFEMLRRPFEVTADVPYTDVWTFPTVGRSNSKHVCEKPLAMMEHMVRTSSRSGAVVLDSFAGSGVVGEAAVQLGRKFVGIETDARWATRAQIRVDAAAPTR